MITFCETYDKVTEESAEQGDTYENGWMLPGGWKFASQDDNGQNENTLKDARNGEFDRKVSLVELLQYIQREGYYLEGDRLTLRYEDYAQGESITQYLHVKGDRAGRAVRYAIEHDLRLV